MSAETIIENYTDTALLGVIEQLRKAEYLGKWSKDRIAVLEAEARRRNLRITKP